MVSFLINECEKRIKDVVFGKRQGCRSQIFLNFATMKIIGCMLYTGICKAIMVGLLLLFATDVVAQSNTQRTTEDEDTLREIIVRPDTVIRVGISPTLRQDMLNQNRYSLSSILDRRAPVLKDQMLHPFAIQERKYERKRKKVQHVLDDYDARRDPLQELLDSVARARGYVPERKNGAK